MKLGLIIGYWNNAGPPGGVVESIAEAEIRDLFAQAGHLCALLHERIRTHEQRLLAEVQDGADDDRALAALAKGELLPGSLDRALPRDSAGARALPPTVSLDEPQMLLSLLPLTLPPYPVGSEVPGTPYRLDALLGQGGFASNGVLPSVNTEGAPGPTNWPGLR